MDVRAIALQYVSQQQAAPMASSSSAAALGVGCAGHDAAFRQRTKVGPSQPTVGLGAAPFAQPFSRHQSALEAYEALLPNAELYRSRVPNGHAHPARGGDYPAGTVDRKGGDWSHRRADVALAPSRQAPPPPAPSSVAPPPPPTRIHQICDSDSTTAASSSSRYQQQSLGDIPYASRFMNMHLEAETPSEQWGHHSEGLGDPLDTLLAKVGAARRAGALRGRVLDGHASEEALLGGGGTGEGALGSFPHYHGASEAALSGVTTGVSTDSAAELLSWSPTHIEGGLIGRLDRLRTAVDGIVVSTNADGLAERHADPRHSGGGMGFVGNGPRPVAHPPPQAVEAQALVGIAALLGDKLNAVEHAMGLHQNQHIVSRASMVRDGDRAREMADDCEFRLSEVEASAHAKLSALKARVQSQLDTSAQLRENWVVKVRNAISAEVRSANLRVPPHSHFGDRGASSSASPVATDPSAASGTLQAAHAHPSSFRQQVEEMREVMLQYQTHADARMTSLQLMLSQQLCELQNQLKGASYLVYRRGGIGTSYAGLSYLKSSMGGGGGDDDGLGSRGASAAVGVVGRARSTSAKDRRPSHDDSAAGSSTNSNMVTRFDNRTPIPHQHYVVPSLVKGSVLEEESSTSLRSPIAGGSVGWLNPRVPVGAVRSGGSSGANASPLHEWAMLPALAASRTTMHALAGGLGSGAEECRNRFLEAVGKVRAELAQLRIERTQFESHFIDRIVQLSSGGGGSVVRRPDGITLNTRGLVGAMTPMGGPRAAASTY